MRLSRHIPALLDHLIWVILIAVFIFFMTQSPVFLSPTNITNILSAAAILGILVVGQTFVLITGNFDLSTESTLGLAGLVGMFLIVPATAPYWGGGLMLNPYLSIVVLLGMGAVIGYVVGALITIGKMNNFIVTLAMLLILRGLIMAFTKGTPISGLGFEPAETYFWLGHKALFEIPGVIKIPVAVVATALVFVIGHIILNHRRFGRELYAIGGNRQAAIASGIDADARIRQVYVLSGLLAALAGWMLAGRVGSIQANLGEGYIFTVMAAAVIGGISLQGGRGTMLGALGGVLLLSTIDRGLNLMNVNVFWVKVIQGLIIMLAMFIDAQRVRFRTFEKVNQDSAEGKAKPIG
ncbi:ABC transporter permease [Aestuariivirga sp.]|jgi:simple sugar transport system permease protein|uniref:ABC transporter permease n=1 Tax=Aestuariivirga sp. TaxID=2650926 RepID=UPI003783447A